jgi:hypothetical protein
MTRMRLATATLVAFVVAAALSSPVEAQPRMRAPASVTGIWQWRAKDNRGYGRLFLIQDGPNVRGAFLDSSYGGGGGDLEGTFDGRWLTLRRRGPGRDPELTLMSDPSGSRLWGELTAQRVFPAGGPGPGDWEVNAPPPPPPPPPVLRPIDERAFNDLIGAVGRESFSENRMSVLNQAASYHYFIVDQVARLLPLFTFEDSKIQALETLRPRILDPQNGFKLSDLFMSSSARQRAQQIMMPNRGR